MIYYRVGPRWQPLWIGLRRGKEGSFLLSIRYSWRRFPWFQRWTSIRYLWDSDWIEGQGLLTREIIDLFFRILPLVVERATEFRPVEVVLEAKPEGVQFYLGRRIGFWDKPRLTWEVLLGFPPLLAAIPLSETHIEQLWRYHTEHILR